MAARKFRIKPVIAIEPGSPLIPQSVELTKAQRARVQDYRREQIAYLVLIGWTVAQIGERFGMSNGQVSQEIETIQQSWRQQAIEYVEQSALLDLKRLDFIIAGLLPRVMSEDTMVAARAADSVIKAIQEKGAILGYRQGVTIDIESYIRQVAEANGYDPEQAVEIATKIQLSL